ncbi:FecR family protein [Pedobacter sp. SL55]|uniref:FecR family protein n=1 Tax=Pedobacter sp. SL55 TaxID=2995161 RepID=UPI0022721349|nr:FecR domain-containing protein [Pedobacter sp. SL55]WAC39667.1 FecR domain-containing protein [Pedobacter sp. SL55]
MEDQIWNNIVKRLTGVETEEIKLFLDQWLNANEKNTQLYEEAEQLWQFAGLLPAAKKQAETNALIHPAAEQTKRKSFKSIFRYSIAASLAVISSLSVYSLSKLKPEVAEKVYTVHKATNGKVMKVTLPDSSTIWLNAGSEVSYPKDFHKQKTRAIHLIGEAFFEVTHNQKQPFVVESGQLKTIVYGTSFNISSYKNSRKSSVTVKTGKVGVLLRDDSLNKPTMLLPGNRLVYHRDNGKLEKGNIYVDEVATWISGDLIFEQATPKEVFAALERKFAVEFSFNNKDFEGCKLTAKFPNQSLKAIQTALSASLHVKFKERGKNIEIIGGQSCK